MESQNNTNSQAGSEVSLKDLILKVQDWIRHLWGKKWLILICGLLGAGIGITVALVKKPLYVAKLTFVLEDQKSSPLSAYAGIASQFGIDLGGSSSSGIFSGDNIIEFLKSRMMVEKTLLSPVITNDRPISLADYYIEIYGLREDWKEKPELKDVHYPISGQRKNFTVVQDSILQTLYEDIVKKSLIVEKPVKNLSFIKVECSTRDENFSKGFTERLVKVATDFYVETKTQRTKLTVDKLQTKADSVEALLNKKTYSVAANQDMNLNPARNVAGVTTELITRDKIVLQTMYGEIIKNLELSRMAMAQETPIIQTIDTPILPLEKKKIGKAKSIIIGGILGGFLIICWLIILRIYKNIMASH